MEKPTDSAYKPRARKVPGGESVQVADSGKPNEPIKLRELPPEGKVHQVRWVLTDNGWESQ